MIPPGRPGYEASVQAPDVDPAAAKKLLADAGFANGQGLPQIKLTYGNTARGKTHAEFMQNEFKTNLGLDLPLDPVDRKALVQMRKKNETLPQMTLAGWCQDYPDAQDWLSVVFRSDSAIEPTGWKNDKFDQLTKQADVPPATQQAQRLDLYKQAQQILVDDAPVIFLYWDVADFVIKPYMQGMKENISPSDQEIPGFSNILNITSQK